jgi:predicted dehydrogenase
MLSAGALDMAPLITHRYAFDDVVEAYDTLLEENPLGVVLSYGEDIDKFERTVVLNEIVQSESSKAAVGLLGVGSFSKMVLLPALKNSEAELKTLAGSGGIQTGDAGRRFGFSKIVSEYDAVLADDAIDTVFIVTRHNSHASLVCKALEQNKHVFVEKPLALNTEELSRIIRAYKSGAAQLMVGFNRRFSPFSQKLKQAVENLQEPLCINMTVNAGKIPSDHWVHDSAMGGGRIIGEACHFIDLARYFTGSKIEAVTAMHAESSAEVSEDKMSIILKFENGSIATINYFANGSKLYPKERIEVFGGEKVFVIDNFKSLKSFGAKTKLSTIKQDKGHQNEVNAFIRSVKEATAAPIPFEELVEVTLASFAAVESAAQMKVVGMDEQYGKLVD